MPDHGHFILIQLQLLQNQGITFDDLSGAESKGQSGPLCVVFDNGFHSVDRPVDGSAVIIFAAKILFLRPLLISGNMYGMVDQLPDTFVFGGGNGNNRNTQKGLHTVDVNGTVIVGDFIHHVERHDHGNMHFQKLHGQIQISLNVGGVYDIDDGLWFVPENKISRHDLLAGVRGHGIDAREIGNSGVGMAFDGPILAVHRNAGEIAHMLVGTGQLVK